MEVKAKARFIRQSPRKVRLVLELIKNMDVKTAQDQLSVLPKKASETVLKLLNSAIANAKHNNKKNTEDLFVAQAFADQGPTIKRFRPRAFGRAGAIRKRTSHITIVLGEKKKTETKIEKSTQASKAKISSSAKKENKPTKKSQIENSKKEIKKSKK